MRASLIRRLLRLFSFEQRTLTSREGYDLWAASYHLETNPIKLSSNETVFRLLPSLSGKDILDLGCGSGYFCEVAHHQNARTVTGVDHSPKMLQVARENPRLQSTQFIQASADQLPLESESFDVVIVALVAGHVENLTTLLSEIGRVLRPAGFCVLSDFHPVNTVHGAKRTFVKNNTTFEIRHYLHTPDEYRQQFKACGFVIQDIAEPVWNGTPVVLAIKAMKSQRAFPWL